MMKKIKELIWDSIIFGSKEKYRSTYLQKKYENSQQIFDVIPSSISVDFSFWFFFGKLFGLPLLMNLMVW